MGYMGIYYNVPEAIFYLLKGDYNNTTNSLLKVSARVDGIVRIHHRIEVREGPTQITVLCKGNHISFHIRLGQGMRLRVGNSTCRLTAITTSF